jgi:hypothetical protein
MLFGGDTYPIPILSKLEQCYDLFSHELRSHRTTYKPWKFASAHTKIIEL